VERPAFAAGEKKIAAAAPGGSSALPVSAPAPADAGGPYAPPGASNAQRAARRGAGEGRTEMSGGGRAGGASRLQRHDDAQVVVVHRAHDGRHRRVPLLGLDQRAAQVVHRGARLVLAGPHLHRRPIQPDGLRRVGLLLQHPVRRLDGVLCAGRLVRRPPLRAGGVARRALGAQRAARRRAAGRQRRAGQPDGARGGARAEGREARRRRQHGWRAWGRERRGRRGKNCGARSRAGQPAMEGCSETSAGCSTCVLRAAGERRAGGGGNARKGWGWPPAAAAAAANCTRPRPRRRRGANLVNTRTAYRDALTRPRPPSLSSHPPACLSRRRLLARSLAAAAPRARHGGRRALP